MKSRGIKSLCSAAVAAALIVALGLASCVREPEITGVKLDKTSLSLTTGETATLTATIQPSDASGTVTWSSSDASVATVLNGSVVAVKAGTATITASVEAFKATCSVTVTDPVINVTGVAVEPASAAIEEEETVQLKATVSPANATNSTVSWSSADNKIATVSSDGLVTGVAEGSTKITASAGGMSGTCTITVSKKIIYATSITLDKTELELTEGESATLAATVAPENVTDPTVRWASSDEAVATVDGGVVTAVSPGTATVTATCGSVSAECAITVLKKVIPVSGITLDKTVLELAEGESADLTATVAPEDATDKTVTWSSSNEAVATVSADGLVKAVAGGEATITAAAGDCTATCKVTVAAPIITYLGKQKNSVGNYYDIFDISNTDNCYYYYDYYSESVINNNGGIETVMSTFASEIDNLLKDYSVEDLLSYEVLAQGDGKYAFKAIEIGSYYIFLLAYDSNGKYLGPTYLTFAVTEYPWKKLGSGKYTDDVACGLYDGLYPITVNCNVYESKETPGIYMINGFQLPLTASIFKVSEEEMRPYTGNWRDSDIVINASDPDNVFIELQDYGVCLNSEDGFIDGITSLYDEEPYSVGTLDNNTITFKTKKGLLCTLESDSENYYYANQHGMFKLVLPKSNKAPGFKAPARQDKDLVLKKGKLAAKVGSFEKANLNRY